MRSYDRELVSQSDEHAVVYSIVQFIVDNRILAHVAQQLVDQVTTSEADRLIVRFVILQIQKGKNYSFSGLKYYYDHNIKN